MRCRYLEHFGRDYVFFVQNITEQQQQQWRAKFEYVHTLRLQQPAEIYFSFARLGLAIILPRQRDRENSLPINVSGEETAV